jgi:hypothetical protein
MQAAAKPMRRHAAARIFFEKSLSISPPAIRLHIGEQRHDAFGNECVS